MVPPCGGGWVATCMWVVRSRALVAFPAPGQPARYDETPRKCGLGHSSFASRFLLSHRGCGKSYDAMRGVKNGELCAAATTNRHSPITFCPRAESYDLGVVADRDRQVNLAHTCAGLGKMCNANAAFSFSFPRPQPRTSHYVVSDPRHGQCRCRWFCCRLS